MWVERGNSDGHARPVELAKGVVELSRDCPALVEYLTTTKWPDGGDRTPSTLILFIEDGRWKVCLSDRETDRTLWKSGDTVEDCFLALDQELQTGAAGWRRSTKASAAARGKKG